MWLILQDQLERIESRLAQMPPVASMVQAPSAGPAPELQLVDGVAQIDVIGVLTKERDPDMAWMGIPNTAYNDIERLLGEAQAKGASKAILRIDSPGGHVDGLYSAMQAISTTGLEVQAKVDGLAASAAYMLASQADTISATNELTLIGSVGVVTGVINLDFYKEITNRESPKKRPNVQTEEGVEAIQDELDDIYGILAERIAAGRGTTVEKVNANYGRGAVMSARSALTAKMIDSIESKQTAPKVEAANLSQGVKVMDLKELKANHSELYSTIFQAGVKAERDRVEAHLQLADSSGDLDTAKEAIKAGDGITDKVQAAHLSAQIKRQSIQLREQEAPQAVETETQVELSAKDEINKELATLSDELVLEV